MNYKAFNLLNVFFSCSISPKNVYLEGKEKSGNMNEKK